MPAPEDTISVLLPVHAGIEPAYLAGSLNSIVNQTRRPDELVVVQDGPLPPAHLGLLDQLEQETSVVRIALEVNGGAGVANQTGLEAASGTWIAKADADDINAPNRLETQLCAVLRSQVDVCGAAMAEFVGDPGTVAHLRTSPLTHTHIARRMRLNSPINHPTAFYRRDLAIRAGGYPPMRFMQDYVLFARMLAIGARMINLDEPLVEFRAGTVMHERRRGRVFVELEWMLQRELRACGVVGPLAMRRNWALRMGYRSLPRPVMRWAHQHVASGQKVVAR